MTYVLTTCPDCGVAQLPHLAHCACPEAFGQVSDDDRVWFERHPGQTTRRRPPAPVELLDLAIASKLPIGVRWRGHVVVRKIISGLRVRDFTGLVWEVSNATR